MIATYTRRELMVVAAAREIRDGEVVFVGMRLPLLGFGLAKATHAPNAVGLFENGVIRDRPAEAFIYTMGDPPNIAGAVACLGLNDVMSLLQQGRVDVGFIGGAEIDPQGNLNTTRTSSGGSLVRLPGSGGGGDIASLAGRTVLVVDPYQPTPYGPSHEYWISIDRVVAAILLGIVTHDANLLVVYPPNRASRPRLTSAPHPPHRAPPRPR